MYSAKGLHFENQKKYKSAITNYKKALAIDEKHLQGHLGLIRINWYQNRKKYARKHALVLVHYHPMLSDIPILKEVFAIPKKTADRDEDQ